MARQSLMSRIGLQYPILQGGMTWVSRFRLAAAVSDAGGLGVIGAGGMEPEELRDEIRSVRSLTDQQFGVNVPLANVRPDGDAKIVEQLIEIVLEETVPIVVTGAGSPRRFTKDLQAGGAFVLHVVPSVELATKCEEAGVDAVIAESVEAGGHLRPGGLSSFALIPQVVDAVSLPVVAAGGIADARGVAAALALGASAVQIGTRFISTVECSAHAEFKRLLVEATAEGTSVYCSWHHASRALCTPAVQRLIEMEAEGDSAEAILSFRGRGRAKSGCVEGKIDQGIFPAGAGAGLIQTVPTVAELMAELTGGTTAIFEQLLETSGQPRLGRPKAA